MSSITDKILSFINEELLDSDSSEQVGADEDLLSDGLLDSISVMRLIAFIEEDLSIKIPPQDLTIENFISVDAISNYLSK